MAHHIDIRTDVSDVSPDEYAKGVRERFALSNHPDVKAQKERREELQEAAQEAESEAQALRSKAESAREKAKAAAKEGRDAESLFEEASDLEAKAERKEEIANAKAEAVEELEEERSTRNREATQEIKKAAQEELGHVLREVKEKWEAFETAFRKAQALDTQAPSHDPLNALDDINLNGAAGPEDRMGRKLTRIFEEYGVSESG